MLSIILDLGMHDEFMHKKGSLNVFCVTGPAISETPLSRCNQIEAVADIKTDMIFIVFNEFRANEMQ